MMALAKLDRVSTFDYRKIWGPILWNAVFPWLATLERALQYTQPILEGFRVGGPIEHPQRSRANTRAPESPICGTYHHQIVNHCVDLCGLICNDSTATVTRT